MDEYVQVIISANDNQEYQAALENFVEKASKQFTFPELNENNLRYALWKSIYNIAKNSNDEKILTNCFAAIRMLSRDKTDLSHLVMTNDWLKLIKDHSGLNNLKFNTKDYNETVAVEVFKCLCNILFNNPNVIHTCIENGIVEGIMQRIKSYKDYPISSDIKFFDMKVLFLMTALNDKVRIVLRDDLDGIKYLTQVLDLILKECNKKNLTDKQMDIACETLKTLFNLTVHQEINDIENKEKSNWNELIELLRNFLIIPSENTEKNNELCNHIINLLINAPENCLTTLIICIEDDSNEIPKTMRYENQNMTAVYSILTCLTNKFSIEPTVSKQNEILSPVLTVLLKCVTSNRIMRKYLRTQILPPLRDVHNRPEQGNTVRNALCRLLTSPITQVKDLAAELLFVLCKQNVNRMIKYTGYGNAAGLFANRGLLGGRASVDTTLYSSESENSDTEEYKELKHGINPVMGCYEPPHPNPTANMTEEQKEYEAMKLVELMDNMTKQGVVRPCKIGHDGRPEPIEHILQLQQGLQNQQVHINDDSD